MLKAANGGSSDEVVFTMKVAADPNAKSVFDYVRKEMEAIRREAQKPIVISVIGAGGAGAGSRPYSTGGSYGGGSTSAFDQQWREKEAAIDAKLKQRQADIREEVRRTNDALREQVKLNAEFNSGMNRTVQGIGQMTSAFGMLSAAMGTDLKAAVQTVAAIEGGLSAVRGVRSVASGISSMIGAGGLAYTAGRAVGSLGGAAVAIGGGAALGYGITYARGDENSRRFLYGDVTEALGMHSRGADALAASESFADNVGAFGAGERDLRERGIRGRGGIGQMQYSAGLNRMVAGGNLDDAKRAADARVAGLQRPITGGADTAANESQRLNDLKHALEEQNRIEGEILQKRRMSIREKIDGEQYATRELENQVRIEQERLRMSERQAQGAKENWADMTASERARVDRAIATVQGGGSVSKRDEALLSAIAPDLAGQSKSRRADRDGFGGSNTKGLFDTRISEAQSQVDMIGGMLGDQRLSEKSATDELAALDAEMKRGAAAYTDAVATIMAAIFTDQEKRLRQEFERKMAQRSAANN